MEKKQVKFSNESQHLYDIEAEKMLLGTLICNPKDTGTIKGLDPHDFFHEQHQIIFRAVLSIVEGGDPLDILVLEKELRATKKLKKAGDKKYLMDLATIGIEGITATTPHLVETVREKSANRMLHNWASESMGKIKGGMTLMSISGEMQRTLELAKEALADTGEIICLDGEELLAKEFKADKEVIGNGILVQHGGLIIGGEAGIGKSTIRAEIALRLAKGIDVFELPVNRAYKVLTIQFENAQREEEKRLQAMMKGLGIKSLDNNLNTIRPDIWFDLKKVSDHAALEKIVKKSRADVIIYDSLQNLHRGGLGAENDNAYMRSVLDRLTEINWKLGTTCIVIHHFGKPQEGVHGTDYRLRGAQSIKDWTDTYIALTKRKHAHKELRLLEFNKIRNAAPRKPLLLERNDDYTHSVIEEESLCPPEKVRDLLIEAGGRFETQGEFVKVIVEDLGCAEKTAKKYIKNAIGRTVKEFKTSGRAKGYQELG